MRYLSVLLAIGWLAGCAAVDPATTGLTGVGEEVNNICFVRRVENWQMQNDSAFVFRHDSDAFLVTLTNDCPSLQDNSSPAFIITRRSAASRCLNPGDSLRFGAQDEQPSYCTVNRIFRWSDTSDR